MQTYIRVQTAGDVFRNAARLYLGHFRVFFLAYLIPMAPIVFLATGCIDGDHPTRASLPMLGLWTALAYVMTIPVMAIISDICLGNAPGVRRSYRYIFGRMSGTVVPALLVVGLLTAAGFALLVIPGLFVMTRLMMVAPAVVLERRPMVAAFKRSMDLGRGYYARNLFVALLAYALTMVGGTVLTMTVTLLLTKGAGLSWNVSLRAGELAALIFGPFSPAVIVLIYYDMRARKEAYDSAKLAEDLHR